METGGVVVAVSGGIDSTFLWAVAGEEVGRRTGAAAVLVVVPEPDAASAVRLLQLGVQDVLARLRSVKFEAGPSLKDVLNFKVGGYVNNDEGGTDIRAMVNMVRDYGVETLGADEGVTSYPPVAPRLKLPATHRVRLGQLLWRTKGWQLSMPLAPCVP